MNEELNTDEKERIGDFLVRVDDERPARPDGTCFYCGEPIGGRHKDDCVIPQRWARMRFTIDIDVAVPASWDDDFLDVRFTETSWCANNLEGLLERALERLQEQGRCLCDSFDAECVRLPPVPQENT